MDRGPKRNLRREKNGNLLGTLRMLSLGLKYERQYNFRIAGAHTPNTILVSGSQVQHLKQQSIFEICT